MVLAWTGIWCHRTKWEKGKRKKLQMVVLGAKDLLLSRMSRMLPGLIKRMMLLPPMIPCKQPGKLVNIHITPP
jgi:hypothetical protein